ncbi:hypothetical protein BHM03_00060862 [Ensete ventricosum]|nr:hypothetical protein BHM03_00060862 [Ensete ventricosum]
MASASLTSHETEDTKIRSKSIITGSSLAIGEESEEAGGDEVGEYYKQKHHPYKKGSSLLFPPSFWARKGGQMVWQKEAIKVGEGMCALRRCTLHEMPDVRQSWEDLVPPLVSLCAENAMEMKGPVLEYSWDCSRAAGRREDWSSQTDWVGMAWDSGKVEEM